MYRLLYPLLLVVALHMSCNPKKAEERKINFYTIEGSNIINPNGEVILLKGTNLGNWLHPEGYMFKMRNTSSADRIDQAFREMVCPEATDSFWQGFLDNYITKEDIVYLKNIGLNHLRIPFNYRMITDETYLGQSNIGFKYLDSVIVWCKEVDLGVILDMHAAPGGQTGDNIDDSYGYPFLFIEESSKQLTVDLWQEIASRYENEPTVIGYDLLNEPIAHYFESDYDLLNPELEMLYKRIVSAIRKVDTTHLIFLGGAQWNTNFNVFGPPFDGKLVYTFHKYWMPPVKAQIQEYLNFREKYNVPIYMGESGENEDEWIHNFRSLLEENDVHWCFWPYKKMQNTRGIMNFDKPEGYDRISHFAESDRSSYRLIRESRPGRDTVLQAMDQFLENAHYPNCYPNEGYVNALGMKTGKK